MDIGFGRTIDDRAHVQFSACPRSRVFHTKAQTGRNDRYGRAFEAVRLDRTPEGR